MMFKKCVSSKKTKHTGKADENLMIPPKMMLIHFVIPPTFCVFLNCEVLRFEAIHVCEIFLVCFIYLSIDNLNH